MLIPRVMTGGHHCGIDGERPAEKDPAEVVLAEKQGALDGGPSPGSAHGGGSEPMEIERRGGVDTPPLPQGSAHLGLGSGVRHRLRNQYGARIPVHG